jgi:hypothetical protein
MFFAATADFTPGGHYQPLKEVGMKLPCVAWCSIIIAIARA